MSKWQPIETAPKDGTRIYAVRWVAAWPQSLWHVSTVFWQPLDDGGGIWMREDRNEVDEPTHWLPIAEPPQ